MATVTVITGQGVDPLADMVRLAGGATSLRMTWWTTPAPGRFPRPHMTLTGLADEGRSARGVSYLRCAGPRGLFGFSGAEGAKDSVTIAIWVVGRFSVATSQ